MYIRWIPFHENDVIFLSKKIKQNFKIDSKRLTLHFGAWKKKLKVLVYNGNNDNIIGLSENLVSTLTIPDTLPYDMYIRDDNLYLGPVIAYVVRKKHLNEEKLIQKDGCCQNYAKIRGLIFFCAECGFDFHTETIKGYYYDPNSKKKLKSGVFPFPGAIYRRTRINKNILQKINKQVNGKVFNAYIFNKWEMWNVLSETGFSHTPYTNMLDGIDSINNMFIRYDSVYLKPIIGRFGKGIQRVDKTPDGYLFKERSGIEMQVENLTDVFDLINKYKKNREYIIQQAVPLTYENKLVDFRVIMQKDGKQEWTCSGILARIGFKGLINTNDVSTLSLASDALKKIYGFQHEQALEKEKEIIRVSTKACLIVERAYGYFGDVGIDIVVDQNMDIWVLEINMLHQHVIAKYLGDDLQMYNQVVSKPFEYAKALAGFNE